jgi:NADH-quinone oxidoreductase subunit N
MTIAMLALAGIPGTAGFIGKFQLIHALVNGDYTWLAIVLVVASMISLGYYLRVVATMWMTGPATAPAPYAPIAGGSQEADSDGAPSDGSQPTLQLGPSVAIPVPEIAFVALLFAAASVFFGIFPSPLFDLVNHAGTALGGLVP